MIPLDRNAEAGFRSAIADAPDDDTPRLIYADWLEENGQAERAEFIRVQIELARGVHDDQRRGELRIRERELLRAHRATWDGELPPELAADYVYERGLPRFAGLAGQSRPAADPGIGVREDTPIRWAEVSIVDRGAWKWHLQSSALAQATGLRIPGRFVFERHEESTLVQLLRMPIARRLRGLDVGWGSLHLGVSEADIRCLADARSLGNLTTLLLRSLQPDLSPDWLELLGRSRYLPRLTSLQFPAVLPYGRNAAGFESALAELFRSGSLARLRTLILDPSSCGTTAVTALLVSPLRDSLRHLELELDRGVGLALRSALQRWFGPRLRQSGEPTSSERETAVRIWSAVCQHPASDTARLAYADFLLHLARRGPAPFSTFFTIRRGEPS